jgi:hypothetical protein
VRSRLAWLLGAIGVAGAIAYLRRQRTPEPSELPEASADELRRTLEQSRQSADELPEPRTETPEADAGELEGRRQDVHERGRSALDEMNPSEPD